MAVVVAGMLFVLDLALLMADARSGLDLTDEGHYLLAADNRQPSAAFNGWFGRYTGLLFAAVDHDIASFRVVGVLLLALAGSGFAAAMVQLVVREGGLRLWPERLFVSIAITSGALLNYSLFIRTPGYNWLTFIGTMLAVAGLLGQLGTRRAGVRAALLAGALVGTGSYLALVGKSSAGIALAVLVVAVALAPGIDHRPLRIRVALIASASGAILMLLHVVFIADPTTTIDTLVRSLSFLAVVDPDFYRPAQAISHALGDLVAVPGRVIISTSGLVVLGLAPLLPLRWAGSRASGVAVLSIAAIAAVALLGLIRGDWVGGVAGYGRMATAGAAVLATALLALATATLVRGLSAILGRPRNRRLLLAAVVLLWATGAYAFGSNNGFVRQTSGAAVLILTACGLLASIPLQAPWRARTLAVVSLLTIMITVVVLVTARADPYRTAPLASASETIAFGPRGRPLTVDRVAAAYWRQLVAAARDAGWTEGSKLLDLTWSPAVSYALGATVPVTLLPSVGKTGTADNSIAYALRESDPNTWTGAWLLVSPDLGEVSPASVLATIGRSFPDDYRLVVSLTAPGRGLRQQLWRPSVGASP